MERRSKSDAARDAELKHTETFLRGRIGAMAESEKRALQALDGLLSAEDERMRLDAARLILEHHRATSGKSATEDLIERLRKLIPR
jgi:hypothetical protein